MIDVYVRMLAMEPEIYLIGLGLNTMVVFLLLGFGAPTSFSTREVLVVFEIWSWMGNLQGFSHQQYREGGPFSLLPPYLHLTLSSSLPPQHCHWPPVIYPPPCAAYLWYLRSSPTRLPTGGIL